MAEECPLSAPLTLRDIQSGVAGETGTVWTIAPDCSFTIARQLGRKLLDSHAHGHLTPDQRARLKDLMGRLSLTDFPKQFGALPRVNPRRLTLSYGGHETALALAPGGGDIRRLRASVDDARARKLVELAAAIRDMLGG